MPACAEASYQNQRKDCNINVAFKCFKNVVPLKHLGRQ